MCRIGGKLDAGLGMMARVCVRFTFISVCSLTYANLLGVALIAETIICIIVWNVLFSSSKLYSAMTSYISL